MWSLGGFQRWQEAWREEGSLGRWWGGEPGTSSHLPRAMFLQQPASQPGRPQGVGEREGTVEFSGPQ